MNELRLKSENGFTLIEALLAMGIFAIGSLAVVSLYYSSTRGVRSSNEMTDAVFMAEKYLSQTLARPYDSTPTDGMKDRDEVDGRHKIAIRVDRTGSMTKESSPVPVKTALITVTVSWGSGLTARQHSVQYVRAETKSSGI